ncbi:alpha/beta fold hydrolase [Occallatibacter riparius]|uniref:Alpha/beta hydrolase n=1 Tax=Occallatibacter riparius TaxID=1002689 RepID=A0A9J7BI75_9BACT|nr:alpha/beta hydrolase [Occallatibacter riparius]UWZ82496.1 alpha/beta hydrolase [Occallatibacter riparius]
MSQTYRSDGAALNYVDEGHGTPVVFLHPTPLDHDYWRPMIAELRGVRAILPDFRGHGASELGADLPIGGFSRVPDAPVLTMSQLARDVLSLLDHLSIQTAIFAGCSIGGYVLMELWRQAPQRMRGLAFICSKPQADGEPALQKRADNIARVRAEGVSGFFNSGANSLLGASARRRRPELVNEVRARMTLSTEGVVAVQAGLATRPDSLTTVKTITVPVLSIAGGEDGAVSAADMAAFGLAPGGCASHVIADAGHFAAYEQPGRVAGLVQEWLNGIGPT